MSMRNIAFMFCNRLCNKALIVTVGVGLKKAHDVLTLLRQWGWFSIHLLSVTSVSLLTTFSAPPPQLAGHVNVQSRKCSHNPFLFKLVFFVVFPRYLIACFSF